MLFHITATHTADNCPMYNPELQPKLVEAAGKSDALAKELNLKVHFSVTGAPDHVFFHLVEAESLDPVRRWLASIPMKQAFTITPVETAGAAVASVAQQWASDRG